MKKIFILSLFIYNFQVQAQVQTVKAVSPLMKGEKTDNKADTIISKNVTDPSLEDWVIHNVKGTVIARGSMQSGRKEGVWREYGSANGVISKLEEYHVGRKNGVALTFTMQGQVTSEENFLNDSLHGKRVTYLNSGRPKSEENYVKGTLDGSRKTFYENGKIQEEANYKMGVRDGLNKWYSLAGTPTLEYYYNNGNLQGPAKEYGETGLLKREGNFMNNDEDGEWKVYKDSTLEKKVIYKSGQVVKEIPAKK